MCVSVQNEVPNLLLLSGKSSVIFFPRVLSTKILESEDYCNLCHFFLLHMLNLLPRVFFPCQIRNSRSFSDRFVAFN